jgi:hypothetical protein
MVNKTVKENVLRACLPPHFIRLFVAVTICPSGLVLYHRQINTRPKKSAEEAYSFAVEQLQELVGKADDHRLDADGR